MGALAIASLGPRNESTSLDWRTDIDAALAYARRTDRFAIVDFTADWCLVCHELDSTTFRDPDVAALLRKAVRIRVDATEIDDGIESTFSRFRVLGLPNVVLIDPRGHVLEHARVVSFVSPEDYVKTLREAGSAPEPTRPVHELSNGERQTDLLQQTTEAVSGHVPIRVAQPSVGDRGRGC